jgi:hypothetical protein
LHVPTGATKTTVIAVAGAAGAVCGPAAVACGSAFAVTAGTGWDAADSAVAGETRGVIRQAERIYNGEAGTGYTKLSSGHYLDFVNRLNNSLI